MKAVPPDLPLMGSFVILNHLTASDRLKKRAVRFEESDQSPPVGVDSCKHEH